MKTQQQARALMTRHQQILKNRFTQAILERSAAEIGLEGIKPLYNNCTIN